MARQSRGIGGAGASSWVPEGRWEVGRRKKLGGVVHPSSCWLPGGLAGSLEEETAVTAKSLPQRADGPPAFTQHQSWVAPGPASPAQTQHPSPVRGQRGDDAQQGQRCHLHSQTRKRTGVVGSCPWWERVIPASNPASIPHSCPCGRGRQEQGMSDGAVRA